MLPALQKITPVTNHIGPEPMVLQFTRLVAGYNHITVDELLEVLYHALGEKITDERQLKVGNILLNFEDEEQVLSKLEQDMWTSETKWQYIPNQQPPPTLLQSALNAFFELDPVARQNLLTSYLNKERNKLK